MDPIFILPLVIGIVMVLLPVVLIVFTVRYRRVYLFSVHGHEAKVELKAGGVFLYVDGTLEEQISGQKVRFVTLRAIIDGEEFKVHLTAKGTRPQIQATHGGREVQCIGVQK